MSRSMRFLAVVALLLGSLTWALSGPSVSAASSLHYLFGSGSQTGGKRITLRVELTEPAPSGGVNVALAASSGAVQIPAMVHVGTGSTEKEFTVATTAVPIDTNVTLTASLAGVVKTRSVLIKAPLLSSIGLQSIIRHGGTGKVIMRLSGPAPAGGFGVSTSTDPSGHLLLDEVVTVPAGENSLSIAAPAYITELQPVSEERLPDLAVSVTVSDGSGSFTKSAIIRDFGDDPRPTPTVTNTPLDTATPTETATATDTVTATDTAIPTDTATPTETATDVPTDTPMPTDTATATETATSTEVAQTVTMSFGPGSEISCSQTVHATGFTPNTSYLLEVYVSGHTALFVSQNFTTDGSGNLDLFVSGGLLKGYGDTDATFGGVSSQVYPITC